MRLRCRSPLGNLPIPDLARRLIACGGIAGLLWLAPGAQAAPDEATALNNQAIAAAHAGRFDEAAALLRRARAADPADTTVSTNLSGILTDWASQLDRAGQTDAAIGALREALEATPEFGPASVVLADVLYLRRSQLDEAIRLWESAHGRVPPQVWQGVSLRLSQAKRDRLLERGFGAHRSAHFVLRSSVASPAELAALAGRLEAARASLASAFPGAPPTLTVLVYPAAELSRVYGHRDWAIGLYDGRLRLRHEDLGQPYLPDVVAHELTHAFLHAVYGSYVPVWVHEGYAQARESGSMRSPEAAALEAAAAARTSWVPLKWLDRRFQQPSGSDDIARAYAEAAYAVKRLLARRGDAAFHEFLAALASGAAVDRAFDAAFAPLTWARVDQGNFD